MGHTRASLLWHRAQVIGIFAGFVVLLLVASPLLLIAAPCIFCCRCKSCQELEEEFEAANSPTKTSRSNSGGIAIQIMKDWKERKTLWYWLLNVILKMKCNTEEYLLTNLAYIFEFIHLFRLFTSSIWRIFWELGQWKFENWRHNFRIQGDQNQNKNKVRDLWIILNFLKKT